MYILHVTLSASNPDFPGQKYAPVRKSGLFMPKGKSATKQKITAEVERLVLAPIRKQNIELELKISHIKIERLKADFVINQKQS